MYPYLSLYLTLIWHVQISQLRCSCLFSWVQCLHCAFAFLNFMHTLTVGLPDSTAAYLTALQRALWVSWARYTVRTLWVSCALWVSWAQYTVRTLWVSCALWVSWAQYTVRTLWVSCALCGSCAQYIVCTLGANCAVWLLIVSQSCSIVSCL